MEDSRKTAYPGYRFYPQVHDSIWDHKFGIWLLHLWHSAPSSTRNDRRVQNRLVYGISNLGIDDSAGSQKQKTFLQEYARKTFADSYPAYRDLYFRILLLFAELFGFKPLPVSVIIIIGAIIGLYVLTAEAIKRIFYKRVKF